jgi:hypothetical protein
MRRLDLAVIAVAVGLLLCATVPWIGALGLEYDEAHFLPLAVQIANGAESRLELPWGVTIAQRPIPFLTMPYVGVLDAFVYAAPYSVFGSGVVVSRGTNLFLAALIFVLAWWVAWREGGVWAGVGALALLLVDVELVLHFPTHFGPFLLQQVLGLAAVAALQEWWRNGRGVWFFVAVGSLALAFHEKLTFIWILSSLGLGVMLFRGKRTWEVSRWWFYPAGLLLAVVIVSPILYVAYAMPEFIFSFGRANTKMPADWGKLAAERWHVLDLMMRGTWTMEFTTGPVVEGLKRGPALLVLFVGGLVAALYTRQRMALILYTTAVGVFVWNFAFPEAGRVHHLLLMAPFWQVGAAIAVSLLGRPLQVVALLLVLWSGWVAVRCYGAYNEAVHRTGGVHHWSDMSARAAEWLEANPRLEPVTTSWGLARPLISLSSGRLQPVEHYSDTLGNPFSPEIVDLLTELIQKERQVWLVSSVMPVYEEQWARVVELAGTLGKNATLVQRFGSRDGSSQIAAYSFDVPQAAVSQWSKVEGTEFALNGSRSFRLQLSGRAVGEAESLEVEWLDDAGQVVLKDARNFHWTPHLGALSSFEFTPGYWPRGFRREVHSRAVPVRIRIHAALQNARILSIEVATP